MSKAEIKNLLGISDSASRQEKLQLLASLYASLMCEDPIDGTAFDVSVLGRLDSTRIDGLAASEVVHCQKVERVVHRIICTTLGDACEVIGKRIYKNKQQIGTLDKVCIAYTLNEDKHVPRVHQREASQSVE